jgi:uncharacterized protein (TIRG00374 family)
MSRTERILRWSCWIVGIAAFVVVAWRADVGGALPVIVAAGPLIVLGLVPYLGQIGLDALAWRTLLGGLGHRPRWRQLLAIRLATEAVLLTVPAGTLVGESLKPVLLGRASNVPTSHAAASVALKRSLLAFAQSAYLALAFVVGRDVLARASTAVVETSALPYLVAAASAVLFVVAIVLGLAFVHGRISDRVHRLLLRLPGRRLREALDKRRAGFASADLAMRELGGKRMRVVAAATLLLGAWLVETLETWLLCALVGIDLSFASALAMEASVVVVRNAAFFVPAGLGVQDAAYLAFLGAYGVAAPVAAAFAIVKRCKELAWVGIGYAVLAVLDRTPKIERNRGAGGDAAGPAGGTGLPREIHALGGLG